MTDASERYAELRRLAARFAGGGYVLADVRSQDVSDTILALLADNTALREALEVAREALDSFAGEASRFHIGASENYRYKPDKHSRLSTASFYLARDAMPIIDAALASALPETKESTP